MGRVECDDVSARENANAAGNWADVTLARGQSLPELGQVLVPPNSVAARGRSSEISPLSLILGPIFDSNYHVGTVAFHFRHSIKMDSLQASEGPCRVCKEWANVNPALTGASAERR